MQDKRTADHMKNRDMGSIESLLIKQLYKEYEQIIYSYNLKLQAPNIIISKVSSYYGQWCSQTRTISLSCSLLLECTWSHVLQILKHEMAHQYVDELMGLDDNHGVFFKKACGLLRVEKWAQRACFSVKDSLFKISEEQEALSESKELRIVRKLLRLGASTNKHEAFLALQKAAEIAKKYQIQDWDLKEENNFVSLIIKTKRKKIHGYEVLVGNILIEHFLVKVIYSSLFNKETMCEEKTVEIFGSPQNVKMAEYVYIFLLKKIQSLWKEHQVFTGKKGIKLKNQFLFGVLGGLQEQLEQERKKTLKDEKKDSKSKDLCLYDQRLLDYVSYKYPKVHQSRSSSSVLKSKEYYQGFEEGGKIKIRTPLGQSRKIFLK